jgi:hypothetical protein
MAKYDDTNIKLTGCHPRDIIDQIVDEAHYVGKPAIIDKKVIDQVWEDYFVHS